MLNKSIIMGRLTRDPELRRTGSGLAVASFCVAVERDYPSKETGEKETDFINCVAWRQTGEFISKWFTKGSMIVVSGRLQTRSWTDESGNKRYATEIVADDVYFGEGKKDREAREGTYNTPGYSTPNYGVPMYSPPSNTDFAPLPPRFKAGGIKPAVPDSDWAMLMDDDAQLPF